MSTESKPRHPFEGLPTVGEKCAACDVMWREVETLRSRVAELEAGVRDAATFVAVLSSIDARNLVDRLDGLVPAKEDDDGE